VTRVRPQLDFMLTFLWRVTSGLRALISPYSTSWATPGIPGCHELKRPCSNRKKAGKHQRSQIQDKQTTALFNHPLQVAQHC